LVTAPHSERPMRQTQYPTCSCKEQVPFFHDSSRVQLTCLPIKHLLLLFLNFYIQFYLSFILLFSSNFMLYLLSVFFCFFLVFYSILLCFLLFLPWDFSFKCVFSFFLYFSFFTSILYIKKCFALPKKGSSYVHKLCVVQKMFTMLIKSVELIQKNPMI
jgi:hypothetical protein